MTSRLASTWIKQARFLDRFPAVADAALCGVLSAGQTDLLRRSRFTPHVGSTFTSTSAAGRWSVVLASVADLGPGGVAGGEKQFAVSFTGTLPGDGVYTFARKGFTATPLFVVAARGRPLAVVNCL